MHEELTPEEIIAEHGLRLIQYDADKTEAWRKLCEDRPMHLEYAARQKIPHLVQLFPHDGRCAIVGGAPSVSNHLEEINTIKNEEFGLVVSLNGAHKFLVENGVPPNIHPIFEMDMASVEQCGGSPPHKDVYYYVCSHCMPKLFRSLKGFHKVLWHCFDEPPDFQAHIARLFPNEFMIGGGFVTFFRAINIATVLGYRKFEFFGCDCSYEGESTHVEGYHGDFGKEPKLVVAAGTKERYRIFNTTPSLSFLASEFIRFCDSNNRGLSLRVHGDGLMRYLHQTEYPGQYEVK